MNESTGMLDLIEAAWGIIANVSESDWSKQTPEWQAAAVRWRDRYHHVLREPQIVAMELRIYADSKGGSSFTEAPRGLLKEAASLLDRRQGHGPYGRVQVESERPS